MVGLFGDEAGISQRDFLMTPGKPMSISCLASAGAISFSHSKRAKPLALGLDFNDQFWNAPASEWTSLKAWKGHPVPADQPIDF